MGLWGLGNYVTHFIPMMSHWIILNTWMPWSKLHFDYMMNNQLERSSICFLLHLLVGESFFRIFGKRRKGLWHDHSEPLIGRLLLLLTWESLPFLSITSHSRPIVDVIPESCSISVIHKGLHALSCTALSVISCHDAQWSCCLTINPMLCPCYDGTSNYFDK